MEIRLLGPVEISVGRRSLPLGSSLQRLVLAALAADAGQVVSTDTLIDRVWDDPPASARETLYVYVSRMRRVIEATADTDAVRLARRSGGYVLEIPTDRVDILRFRRLVAAARGELADADRIDRWQRVLSEWRGEPLAGMSTQWVIRTRETWKEEYLSAVIAWSDAHLQGGRADAVVGPLTDLVAEHPFAESVAAMFMRSLHAVGRPADALRHYAGLRQRLADELGVDPSAELRAIHEAILHDEPAPGPAAGMASVAPRIGVPRLLPPDVAGFTGRGAELAQLESIVSGAGAEPTAVVISALSGLAGVGKTALAVRWARLAADRFPDGQLYVDLVGFGPRAAAMSSGRAVRVFLESLGVAARQIPAEEAAQVGLYRSLLADRRMLILLDNARDADQVRPLLPGSPMSVVLVTSRNQLAGLVASEGARSVAVGVLPDADARELLARRLGHDRVAAEPAAVADVIARCCGLPLALAIVAARAATSPGTSLGAIAAQLRGSAMLDVLAGDDEATDPRSVFSWSYQGLSAPAARLMRLLGAAPGPDMGLCAVASLAGTSVGEVQGWLQELVRGHLISETAPGRYAMHDLLREYATELARGDSAAERDMAEHRLLDYYLHTADDADRCLDPARTRLALAGPAPGVVPGRFADHSEATAWFTAEHRTLLAVVRHAAERGHEAYAWQFVKIMAQYFDSQGHWSDWVDAAETALVAVRRLPDAAGEAWTHRTLGRARSRLGDLPAALEHYQSALDLFTAVGNSTAAASVHSHLSALLARHGRLREALAHAMQGYNLHGPTGFVAARARALNNVAMCHVRLGEDELAAAACRQALELHREAEDQFGEAASLDTLGCIQQRLGDFDAAADNHAQALSLLVLVGGDIRYRAETLVNLGRARHSAGRDDEAREAWEQALSMLEELEHPDADDVRAHLKGLTASA